MVSNNSVDAALTLTKAFRLGYLQLLKSHNLHYTLVWNYQVNFVAEAVIQLVVGSWRVLHLVHLAMDWFWKRGQYQENLVTMGFLGR